MRENDKRYIKIVAGALLGILLVTLTASFLTLHVHASQISYEISIDTLDKGRLPRAPEKPQYGQVKTGITEGNYWIVAGGCLMLITGIIGRDRRRGTEILERGKGIRGS